MRTFVLVILAIALLEAGALAFTIRMLIRVKRDTGALLPVDILPFVRPVIHRKGDEWEIVDDVIQYEDDQRAAFFRQEVGW